MKLFFGVVAAAAMSAMSAQAATLAPADLSEDGAEGAAAVVYAEQTGVAVGANSGVEVDYLLGTNLGGTMSGKISSGAGYALTAGTYDSFLIHFDPLGVNADAKTTGSYDFGGTIVGLIVSNNNANGGTQRLNASDVVFGAAGTVYESDFSRRSENGDTFTLAGSTLTWSFATKKNWIDNARVIVESPAPVPVPASLPLLLVGLGGMAALRRRKQS